MMNNAEQSPSNDEQEEEVIESVGCDGVGVMAGNRPCVGVMSGVRTNPNNDEQ